MLAGGPCAAAATPDLPTAARKLARALEAQMAVRRVDYDRLVLHHEACEGCDVAARALESPTAGSMSSTTRAIRCSQQRVPVRVRT